MILTQAWFYLGFSHFWSRIITVLSKKCTTDSRNVQHRSCRNRAQEPGWRTFLTFLNIPVPQRISHLSDSFAQFVLDHRDLAGFRALISGLFPFSE